LWEAEHSTEDAHQLKAAAVMDNVSDNQQQFAAAESKETRKDQRHHERNNLVLEIKANTLGSQSQHAESPAGSQSAQEVMAIINSGTVIQCGTKMNSDCNQELVDTEMTD